MCNAKMHYFHIALQFSHAKKLVFFRYKKYMGLINIDCERYVENVCCIHTIHMQIPAKGERSFLISIY